MVLHLLSRFQLKRTWQRKYVSFVNVMFDVQSLVELQNLFFIEVLIFFSLYHGRIINLWYFSYKRDLNTQIPNVPSQKNLKTAIPEFPIATSIILSNFSCL